MNPSELVEFFDAPASSSFTLTPEQALAFFRAKGLRTSFSYRDVVAEEHFAAFTVAKMMDTDMLAQVKDSLDDAIARGVPFRRWADDLIPLLQSKGWWGRQAMVDPLTGETVVAQLGSPGRLATIFRTNMQSAYSVGAWERIQEQAAEAPYLLYDAVDDHRTRPDHAAWDGKVYPVDSVFWRQHYPPNGYNCRCGVIQLSDDDLTALGIEKSPPPTYKLESTLNTRTGKVMKHPTGVDPSFAYNPGELRMEQLTKLAAEKAKALDADLAAKAAEGMAAAKAAAEAALAGEVQAALKALAKEVGAEELAKANMKAAERAAQFALDDALANKTPYLSTAIKQVQAAKGADSLKPSEVLAQAKAKAAKLKDTSLLSDFKKAYVAGKTPNAAQQAVFDALPEPAQQAMKEQLDALKAAAAAEKAAQVELAKAAAGDLGKMEANTLAKLEADPAFALKPAVEKLDALKASVAAQKTAISQGKTLADLKKALVAGKAPTPAQQALFDSLGPVEQGSLLAQVDKAKAAAAKLAKPAPEPEPTTTAGIPTEVEGLPTGLDPDRLVAIGGQGGSNPGGLFQDPDTGVKWYVKWPSEEMLRNEVLANRLYALAGVEVPEVRLITFRGRPAIASRIIDGLNADQRALTAGRLPGVQEHFAVDAWLANWDTVGLSFDNLKVVAGRGVRIDPGGSLRFRAQGGLKGSLWSDEVLDLDSLRNAGINSQSAAVFKHVTRGDIVDGVRRILAIPEERIAAMVEEFGPLDVADRKAMLARLLARRRDLAKKYPEAMPEAPAPLPVATRVTRAEQLEIAASRANGYTMPTDGRDVEDHHVVVMHYRDAKGNPKTRATLKLRPEAAKRLLESTGLSSGAPAESFNLEPFITKLSTVLKSINARAAKGDTIPSHTAEAANALLEQFADLQKRANDVSAKFDVAAVNMALEDLRPAMKAVTRQILDGHLSVGAKAVKTEFFNLDGVPRNVVAELREPPQANAKPAMKWTEKSRLTYTTTNISRGEVVETSGRANLSVRNLSTTVKGDEITFVPDASDVLVSARGYVQIDLDGQGEEVTTRLFQRIAQLGVDSARSTQADRLELYLDRHLYVRTVRENGLRREWLDLDSITDQATRNARKLELLNRVAGYDVRTSRNWNPEGAYQAFGHGRLVTNRADLGDAELDKFGASHFLFHNPVGLSLDAGSSALRAFKLLVEVGGQLASQMDRIRRGVAMDGSSVDSDLRTGGANYIFTRIRRRSDGAGTGFYMKPRMVARTDAFSYDGDLFGRVDEATQRARRALTLPEMARHADNSGNETNFRDAVSLFDDVEYIVLEDRQVSEAIDFMRAQGYSRWPDGRALDEVIIGRTAARTKVKTQP